MLKKLYIYDLNSQRKTLFPFLLSMPGLGVIALLLTVLMDALPENMALPIIGCTLLLMFCWVAIAVLFCLCYFWVIMRYYKNFFTDEGYLSFAFPATMKEHLLAKTLSGTTWVLLATAAMILSYAISFGYLFSLIGSASSDAFAQLFATFQAALFGETQTAGALGIVTAVLYIITIPVGTVSGLLLIYLSITLGSLLWTKHKILGSILFYFAVSMAVNFISQFVSGAMLAMLATSIPLGVQTLISAIFSLLLYVAMGIVAYLLSLRMLNKRLNLE